MDLLVATLSYATAAERAETVRFKRGATSTALTGTIRGYDGVKYIVGATSGQLMSVLFRPSNRSCYMNIWPPSADTAVFNGAATRN